MRKSFDNTVLEILGRDGLEGFDGLLYNENVVTWLAQ